MKKTKLFKGIIYLSIAILVGITIGISRIPQISSALRDIIVPELEDISGQKITIENISLNIFPVFIEAKGLNVSSREGTAVLYARQVKAYVSLSGIVRRRITIRRLVISEPDITADRKQIEEIIKNVQEYLSKERDLAIKVKIKVIEIVKGNMYLSDGDLKGTLKGKGFSGELIIGEKQNVKASVKELHIQKEGWPKIICDVNTSLIIQKRED